MYTARVVVHRVFFLLLLSFMSWVPVVGQDADSTKKNTVITRAYRQGLKLITFHPDDTTLNVRNAEVFLPFEDKIIRRIDIQQVGLEKSIYDSAYKASSWIEKTANTLHHNTRNATVRKHVFFKKNDRLNPFLIADNERYLRDRDFILDCRIVVTPVLNSEDSVDITVVTRDVFSLGINLGGSLPSSPQVGVYDNNFLGRGQRVTVTGAFSPSRNPTLGWSGFYKKSSVFGTLVDLELGYTELKTGSLVGTESEYSYSIRLNRPLVSPYSRLAGGLELSNNWSRNLFAKPDSAFRNYRYKVADYWIGYNFGVRQKLKNQTRYFFALRYFDGDIYDQFRELELGGLFQSNRVQAYLGELTIYKQEFYKTRYILGFGRTEDVPVGLSVSFTGGYATQYGRERSYLGAKLKYTWVNRAGNIFRLETQTGGFALNNSSFEDAVVNTRATFFTRAHSIGRNKTRTVVSVGYVALFNRTLFDFVNIKPTDLQGLVLSTSNGRQKLQGKVESSLYTNWKVLGFRMAPFLGADIVVFNCQQCEAETQLASAVSSGIRLRNENLIFGTIEIRLIYFPSTDFGGSNFGLQLNENLRIRNTDLLVRPPSLIPY